MPRVLCPACSRTVNVPTAALGKRGSCPACKHRFILPGGPELPSEQATAIAEEPVARPTSRKKGEKKHEQSADRPGRGRLMVGAAFVLGLLGGVWLLRGGGGGSAAPAREPRANFFDSANPSTVLPHEFPSADPATWKVAAEATDPPPAETRPVVACPNASSGGTVISLTFADPKAATAAVIFQQQYNEAGGTITQPWVQLSLTNPAEAKIVPLTQNPESGPAPTTPRTETTGPTPRSHPRVGTTGPTPPSRWNRRRPHGLAQKPWEVALSPSGNRLATVFQGGNLKDPVGVVIWDRDGHRLAEWPEGEKGLVADADLMQGKGFIRGLLFVSDDRLLVLTLDTLRCREVSTGKLVYERPLKLAGDAVLTPRRTWLLAGVEGGVEAIATFDGSTAGRLTVPGFMPEWGIRLAVSPDGTRLAALACCDTGVPLVVWTLADGKPAYARYYDPRQKRPPFDGRIALPLPLHWAGDRHLIADGKAVYDLDLGGITFTFGDTVTAMPTGAIPDGRVWRLISPQVAMHEKFAAAAPGGGNYLTATTVPATSGSGVVIGPHTSFRVSAQGASRSTAAVRETFADAIADRGYRVDPTADLTLHFEGVKVTKSQEAGREVLNPKLGQRPPNGWRLVKMVDAYHVSYRVSIRERQGRELWQSSGSGTTNIDYEGAWTGAAKDAAGLVLPGLFRLVPDSPPVNLPQKIASLSDGTAELVPDR